MIDLAIFGFTCLAVGALEWAWHVIRRQRRTIAALKLENEGLLEALSARTEYGRLVAPIREYQS